jgi:hypothetical protein
MSIEARRPNRSAAMLAGNEMTTPAAEPTVAMRPIVGRSRPSAARYRLKLIQKSASEQPKRKLVSR